MSTIEEVTALFKDRESEMPPITGKPTNDDLGRLRYILSNLLQAVELPGGTNDKGIIITGANYQAAHAGATFDRLDMPLEAYNPSISSNAMTKDRMRVEC